MHGALRNAYSERYVAREFEAFTRDSEQENYPRLLGSAGERVL